MPILNQFGKPYEPEVATRDLVEGLINISELLPHPSKILKDTGKTIAVFEETLKQPDVAAASRSFHDGIKHLDWDIIGDQTTQRTQLLRNILRDMNLKEICSNAASAREFGYTIFEAKKTRVGNLILIEDLIEKPREWFKFDYQNRLRLITKANPDGILVDEAYPNQFILVQHEPTYKNPYGHAILDEVYWLAEGLKSNFEWHLQFLEDDGRDHWLAYVPQTASQDYITKVQLALAALRRRSVAVLFDGVRAEQRENKGRKSSSDAFVQFEKLAISKINKLFLGSDLAMQLDGTGSYAASKTGYKIRGEALSSGIALAESAINQALNIIQTLSALPNTDTNPRFTLFPPIETDKEQAEIDKLYAEASGSKLSPKLLAKRGYDPDDFITQPEPEAQTFEAPDDLDALLNAVDGLKKKVESAHSELDLTLDNDFIRTFATTLTAALLRARSLGIQSVQNWLNKGTGTLATFETLDLNPKLGNQDAARFIEFQSFAIATVENDRILQTLKTHLKQALSNGKSFQDWKKTANEVFDKEGVSRLKPHHLETVWRTNAMLAYSNGQIAALNTIKDDFPYWQYSAINDTRTRPSHKALHGKIFRTGDYRFFPPIGFNCRCSAIPISKTKANSLGITEPSPITPDLRAQLKHDEFIGNKNETFLKWLLNQAQTLSTEAKRTLNETTELLLESITERNQKDWDLLLNDTDMKSIRKEYKQKGLERNARAMGLSKDEGLLVAAYTSTKYHTQLNRYLRGLPIEKDGRPTRFWRAFKRQLQSILEKLPPYTENNGIVYRVLDINLTSEQQTFYIPDKTLYWANFTSTDKTKNPNPYTLRFTIKSKTGRDITKLSFFFPKEKEILIPPSRFMILEKQITKEGLFFFLEEL